MATTYPRATTAVLGVSSALVLIASIAIAATWHSDDDDKQTGGPAPALTSPSVAPSSAAPSTDAGVEPSTAASEASSPVAPASSAPTTSAAPTAAAPTSAAVTAAPTSPSAAAHTSAKPTKKASASPTRKGTTSSAAATGIKPGTYTYDETGSFTSSFGSQKADGTTELVVGAAGSDGYQHAKKSGGQTTEDQALRFDADQVHLSSLHVTFPTVDETFTFNPAVEFVPTPATPGKTWSWKGTSDDGKATVDYSGKITGTGTDTVGGVSVPYATIVSTIHFVGSGFDITVNETDHYGEAAKVISETDQDAKGTISGVTFTSSTVEKLRSVTPS